MILKINNYLKRSTDSSKLAVFRICFGLMMLFSMVRFWSKDWIHTVYVLPKFHFKYYGFDLHPLFHSNYNWDVVQAQYNPIFFNVQLY